MLSFDFSAFDLVLSIGVIVLIVLFVTTLVKLNPSGENKESKNANKYEEEQEIDAPTQDFSQLDKTSVSHIFPQSAERTTSEKSQQPRQVVVGATTGALLKRALNNHRSHTDIGNRQRTINLKKLRSLLRKPLRIKIVFTFSGI